MSCRLDLGDQMHALAVEITDYLNSSKLHPFCDSVGELSDLADAAQGFGDLLLAKDCNAYVEHWLEHAQSRLAYWRNEEES